MLNDGVYRYYKIDDNDSRTPKGAIKIAGQQLSILSDPQGVLGHMFEEGPISRKTEDLMKSVNRNGYAIFIKERSKKPESKEPEAKGVESVYAELGKNEDIEKGDMANKLRASAMGLAMIASTVASGSKDANIDKKPAIAQQAQAYSIKNSDKINKEKNRILASIVDVESSGGKDIAHDAPHNRKLHGKERAYGSYGLMPLLIRETFKKNPTIFKDHQKAVGMNGSDLHNYMDKNPGLEDKVASAHYDRLSKHFGNDPAKIGYAWLNGITGTKKALKQGTDINNHWHVLKLKNAYDARKKTGSK